jgi:hypothetical protein
MVFAFLKAILKLLLVVSRSGVHFHVRVQTKKSKRELRKQQINNNGTVVDVRRTTRDLLPTMPKRHTTQARFKRGSAKNSQSSYTRPFAPPRRLFRPYSNNESSTDRNQRSKQGEQDSEGQTLGFRWKSPRCQTRATQDTRSSTCNRIAQRYTNDIGS